MYLFFVHSSAASKTDEGKNGREINYEIKE